jgi:hypothetical protein
MHTQKPFGPGFRGFKSLSRHLGQSKATLIPKSYSLLEVLRRGAAGKGFFGLWLA